MMAGCSAGIQDKMKELEKGTNMQPLTLFSTVRLADWTVYSSRVNGIEMLNNYGKKLPQYEGAF